MLINSIQEGSIIVCLDVLPSALSSVAFFLEVIENLLTTVLQQKQRSDNGSTSQVIISLDFIDQNNGEFYFEYLTYLLCPGSKSLLSMYCFVSVLTVGIGFRFFSFNKVSSIFEKTTFGL